MKTEKANKSLDKLIIKINKDHNVEEIVNDLKSIRKIALEEEDPLLVRVFRQIYECLEENGSFDFTIEKEYNLDEDGEEIEAIKEPGTSAENLTYILSLIKKSENKFNREEIKEMRTLLKEEA